LTRYFFSVPGCQWPEWVGANEDLVKFAAQNSAMAITYAVVKNNPEYKKHVWSFCATIKGLESYEAQQAMIEEAKAQLLANFGDDARIYSLFLDFFKIYRIEIDQIPEVGDKVKYACWVADGALMGLSFIDAEIKTIESAT
jgi:hypothetical protein